MRAVVTVIGKNGVGIMAGITSVLAQHRVSILDISQTIMQEMFTMIMIVDISSIDGNFSDLVSDLKSKGLDLNLSIHVQHEDIFNSMHRI